MSVVHLVKIGPDAVRFCIVRRAKDAAGGAVPSSITSVGGTGAVSGSADDVDFKSAAETRAASLAGAIAGKLRSGTRVVSVTAIGPGALLKMIKALALAQEYLQEDKLTCNWCPEAIKLVVAGEERHGLKCSVWPVATIA